MLWFKVWAGLAVCFFFVGWLIGSTIEHNAAVHDLQAAFDALPLDCKYSGATNQQIQEVVKKWNITNMSTMYKVS